jgi:hypothetical protein
LKVQATWEAEAGGLLEPYGFNTKLNNIDYYYF